MLTALRRGAIVKGGIIMKTIHELLENLQYDVLKGTVEKEVTKVKLSEEVVDPDDIEMLEDLVMAATNEALRMAEEAGAEMMNKMTGGLGLGGGFPF